MRQSKIKRPFFRLCSIISLDWNDNMKYYISSPNLSLYLKYIFALQEILNNSNKKNHRVSTTTCATILPWTVYPLHRFISRGQSRRALTNETIRRLKREHRAWTNTKNSERKGNTRRISTKSWRKRRMLAVIMQRRAMTLSLEALVPIEGHCTCKNTDGAPAEFVMSDGTRAAAFKSNF